MPSRLGQAIEAVRLRLRWTRRRLATLLEVTDAAVYGYERGLHKIDPLKLRKIADVAPVDLVGLINEHLPVELRKTADPLSFVPSDIRERIEATASKSKKSLDEYLAEMIILGWQAHHEDLLASTRKHGRPSNSLTPEEVEQRVRTFAENKRRALDDNRPGVTVKAAASRDSKDRKTKTA